MTLAAVGMRRMAAINPQLSITVPANTNVAFAIAERSVPNNQYCSHVINT